jgi:hypothetical protein
MRESTVPRSGMLAVPDIEERGRACQRLHKSVGETLAPARLPVREPSSKKAMPRDFYWPPTIDRKAIWNRFPVRGCLEADRT